MPLSQETRVLLADDHPVVRKGTRELLDSEPGLRVIGEAGDGEEAVRLTLRLRPDLVLMDMSMPVLNGLEATRLIKAQLPGVSVLVLSAYDDDAYLFALLEAGAAGYLLKSVSDRELTAAIHAVAGGEQAIDPALTARLAGRVQPDPLAGPIGDVLSAREQEVLRAAARGRTNKEIARDLDISPRTVQVHLANIFSKLNVASRTEAVLSAIRRGWVDPHHP